MQQRWRYKKERMIKRVSCTQQNQQAVSAFFTQDLSSASTFGSSFVKNQLSEVLKAYRPHQIFNGEVFILIEMHSSN